MICESACSTIVQERWLFLQKQLFGAVLSRWKVSVEEFIFQEFGHNFNKKRTLTLVFFNSLAFFFTFLFALTKYHFFRSGSHLN